MPPWLCILISRHGKRRRPLFKSDCRSAFLRQDVAGHVKRSTTNVSAAFLVDTNVLVYAHDPRDRDKQERALVVLDNLIASERAVLSAQCLSEFFIVVTRRLPEPMTPIDALA